MFNEKELSSDAYIHDFQFQQFFSVYKSFVLFEGVRK